MTVRRACLLMLHLNILDLLQGIATLVMAGALIHFWLAVNRLSRAVRLLEKGAGSPPPAPPAAPDPGAPAAGAIEEGVLAAIAAAVAVVVRQPHRIIAIQPDAGAQRAWSAEGRRELYHSHKVR
jgi:hypothetical protein